MNPIDIAIIINAFGDKLTSHVTIEPDQAIYSKPLGGLPAGNAGSLTTRTDANTGVATLAEGHGIKSADTVDVYWADGIRHGMTATVDVNAVTIDGGAGDDLPDKDTALVVSKQVVISTTFDGDLALALIAHSTKRTLVEFLDAGGVVIYREVAAGGAWIWIWESGDGFPNPLADKTITSIVASNGDASAAAELSIIIPYDAVA